MKKASLSIAVLVAVGALTACGGGGGSSTTNNTSNNNGATAGKLVSGVISSISTTRTRASTGTEITVNGVAYPIATDTTVTVDGTATDETGLAVGMDVTLQAGADGSISSIDFADEVEGVVISPLSTINGVTTINVMGVTVNVLANTLFEGNAGAATLAQLLGGEVVEVSGYRDAAGSVYATRIELKAANAAVYGHDFELKGTVASVDGTAGTFQLTGGPVVLIDSGTDNAMGDMATWPANVYVQVQGASFNASNQLVATKVEMEDDGDMEMDGAEGDDMELQGVAASVDTTANSFLLNGQPVLVDGDEFEDGVTLADIDGQFVKVEGAFDANGNLLADQVSLEHGADAEYGFEASLDAAPAADGTLSIMGQSVQVTSSTLLVDELDAATDSALVMGDLAAADYVEVDAYLDGTGQLIATKVVRKDPDNQVQLQALFTDTDVADQTSWTVAGVQIDVTGAVVSGTATAGTKVEVQGSFDAASGILVATEIAVENNN